MKIGTTTKMTKVRKRMMLRVWACLSTTRLVMPCLLHLPSFAAKVSNPVDGAGGQGRQTISFPILCKSIESKTFPQTSAFKRQKGSGNSGISPKLRGRGSSLPVGTNCQFLRTASHIITSTVLDGTVTNPGRRAGPINFAFRVRGDAVNRPRKGDDTIVPAAGWAQIAAVATPRRSASARTCYGRGDRTSLANHAGREEAS
jgi:hypothetical protein